MSFLDDGRALVASVLSDPDVGGITLAALRVTQERVRTTCTITTAVIGKTVFASNSLQGPRIEHGERDFLIPPGDYKLGPKGVACEPAEGDRFTSVENGVTYRWEVRPVPGEPAWRVTDGGRTMYRVHCQRVTDWRGE